MRRPPLPLLTWVFTRFVPKGDREPLIGDLAEEYELRARTTSSSAASRWYLRQICASIPPLLWARFTRATWPATLGVALLAYFAVGVVQYMIQRAIANSTATFYGPLPLIIVFPIVVLIGYLAERIRPRSAVVMGTLMLLAITAMTLWASEGAPLWYRAAYFVVGPAAAFAGAVLQRRHSRAR
jgi:drug/metabolite transporter (DMT)-like permease